MGVFDGVAVAVHTDVEVVLDPGGGFLRLPDGSLARRTRPPGFPTRLLDASDASDGRPVLVLEPVGPEVAGVVGAHPGPPELGDAWRVVPPAVVDRLVACRPLPGPRVHLGIRGEATTRCGRLPLRGAPEPAGRATCRSCLSDPEVAERHDVQLAEHPVLLTVLDTFTAGATDRLWVRYAHRDPGMLPALLDAMIGARELLLPGAPGHDEVLAAVRTHREVASSPVRDWAAQQARMQLTAVLPRLVARHPRSVGADVRGALDQAVALLDPTDAAELLVGLLEEQGPAPVLESVALQAAERAGEVASPRVVRFRRRHAVAAALGARPGAPSGARPGARPGTPSGATSGAPSGAPSGARS